jgi:hypothetical protein
MSFEAAAGERKLRQRFVLMVTHDEHAMLESPFAAGEEVAGTAPLRRDRALSSGRGIPEIHEAGTATGGRELPAAGQIDRGR